MIVVKNERVNEIRRMVQEEGMSDEEISKVLNITRVTVNRIKNINNIGKRNVNMRKDVKIKCINCDKEFYIRRFEQKEAFCEECRKKIRKNL